MPGASLTSVFSRYTSALTQSGHFTTEQRPPLYNHPHFENDFTCSGTLSGIKIASGFGPQFATNVTFSKVSYDLIKINKSLHAIFESSQAMR